MKLKSYAKLNLYLEVLDKRKDSYHNLVILFERISLCDEILLTGRSDNKIIVSCSHPHVPGGENNLAFRAAVLLRKEAGIDKGANIKIDKHIPVAAGLGGGSSNAAAALVGLNRLWKTKLSRKRLVELAGKLGADIPFFLYDEPFAIATGRGDKITPVSGIKRKIWHILVVPRLLVSTRSIYKALEGQRKRLSGSDSPGLAVNGSHLTGLTKALNNVKILSLALKKGSAPLEATFLFNRLEEVTLKKYPQIKKIKDKLSYLGVEAVLMSGSGAAVFGVVSSRKEGESLQRFFKRSVVESFVVRAV